MVAVADEVDDFDGELIARDGPVAIPERALPRFGPGAFRGFLAPDSSPIADRRMAAPEPFTKETANRVTPVRVTEFSAGNRVRRGIVGVLKEWWRFRSPMSGEIFIARGWGGPDERYGRRRPVQRRMSRVRRLDRVIPNRRVFYQAPEYGPAGDAEPDISGNPASTSADPGWSDTSASPGYRVSRRFG